MAVAKRGPSSSHASFTAGDLLRLHEQIEHGFSEVLRIPVAVHDKKYEWTTLPPNLNLPFTFSLKPRGKTALVDSTEDRGNQILFPLTEADRNGDTAWVAWTETWVKEPGRFCRLKTAGFHFYWGRAGPSEKKLCVVRAEWDQVPLMGGKAGQPHWHVDRAFIVGHNVSEPQMAGVAVADEREIEPKDIHLAMAGWNHKNADMTRWQSRAGTCKELGEWAVQTLTYMKAQLARIRPARAESDLGEPAID